MTKPGSSTSPKPPSKTAIKSKKQLTTKSDSPSGSKLKTYESSLRVPKSLAKLGPASNTTNELLTDNDTDILSVTSVSATDSIAESLIIDKLKQCPCAASDKSATYVVCTKCAQEWHNKCANLDGLTPTAIKKLDNWMCPRCYVSPFVVAAVSGIVPSDIEVFLTRISDIKKCNEELRDSVTTIEFFNAHIKHLLLSDTQFKTHTASKCQ